MIASSGIAEFSCPLEWLEHEHISHARLCDTLEHIADGLPDAVDPRQCRETLVVLQVDLPLHHKDEETGLFPLLSLRARPRDNLAELLAQLTNEHAIDDSFAQEVAEELELLAIGDRRCDPNTLGYMLRGFFEGYRRHLHWENTVLLPLARRRLTGADLDELLAKMHEHRRQARD